MTEQSTTTNAVELATELTIAWLSNPNTRAGAPEATSFLLQMKEEIVKMEGSPESAETITEDAPIRMEGAVSAKKSLASRDHIISMIDGKPYKTLRRHLSTHGMSPEQYRERFGLKADYPMVAESYSEQRREMAKRIGLGTRTTRATRGRQAKAR